MRELRPHTHLTPGPHSLAQEESQVPAATTQVQDSIPWPRAAPLDGHAFPDPVQAKAEHIIQAVVHGGDGVEELLPF